MTLTSAYLNSERLLVSVSPTDAVFSGSFTFAASGAAPSNSIAIYLWLPEEGVDDPAVEALWKALGRGDLLATNAVQWEVLDRTVGLRLGSGESATFGPQRHQPFRAIATGRPSPQGGAKERQPLRSETNRASAVGTSSAATNTAPRMQLNAFVQLPDGSASGFLKYKGQHQGITFYALVTDIGSGIPSQDFCLYACKEGKCQPVVSLPRLQHRGYECSAEADTLNVYVIKRYTDKKPENQELLLSIKLPVLAQSYSQREAGQRIPTEQEKIKCMSGSGFTEPRDNASVSWWRSVTRDH